MNIEKAKAKMTRVTLPEFFEQARLLDLNLRGQSNRATILEEILKKAQAMPAKEAKAKLNPAFLEMAESAGIWDNSAKAEPKKDPPAKAPEPPAEAAPPKEEPKKDPPKPAAKKATKKATKKSTPAKPPKELSVEEAAAQEDARKEAEAQQKAEERRQRVEGDEEADANTGVPGDVTTPPDTAVIEFPREQLDAIAQGSIETAKAEVSMGVKATFGVHGRAYAQIQAVFQDLHEKIQEARAANQVVPRLPTFEEYMTEIEFRDKVDRTDQRLRKDAIVWKACHDSDDPEKGIPEDVMERLVAIGVSKAEEASRLPNPKTAIMKGIKVTGTKGLVPLETMTKQQVIAAIDTLTGKDKPKTPEASRSRKKHQDVPKLLDPFRTALPKLKSSKPNKEKLQTDKGLEKRYRQSLEAAKKGVAWMENFIKEVWDD